MKIAILGFAREGRSTLKFLKKDTEFKGAEIWILDKNGKIEVPAGLKYTIAVQAPGYKMAEQTLEAPSANNKYQAKVNLVTGSNEETSQGIEIKETALPKVTKTGGFWVFFTDRLLAIWQGLIGLFKR